MTPGSGKLHPFESAVRATVRRRRLFEPGARVLAALSGGPDSTALVAVLAALRASGTLSTLHACHVDHQLRPGSRADGDFCEVLCAGLDVPLHRVAVVVEPGRSVQAAARRARYRALGEVANACDAGIIATGHTRSDQAETVLHRLLRGSGARGLAGIPPRRGRIVRPLLDRTRDDVIAYLGARGLAWREDPSNATPRYLRNRIRNELLPTLEALAPGAARRLARTADLLRDDDRALERRAAVTVDRSRTTASLDALREQPLAIRRRAVRRLWRNATGSRRHLGAEHVDAVVRLAAEDQPSRVTLPHGFEARLAYGSLAIARAEQRRAATGVDPVSVQAPGTYLLDGDTTAEVEIGWPPSAPPSLPLVLRTRRAGDRFAPLRAPGGKKLKAWLIDRKIPRAERDALVLVLDARGNVLAIPELGVLGRGAGELRVAVRRDPARAGDAAPELQPGGAPAIKESRLRRGPVSKEPGMTEVMPRLSPERALQRKG